LGFEKLGLANPLLKILKRQGILEPTPIQRESIPIILRGTDLVGLAQTGTGKTVAYCLPILNILCKMERIGKFRPVKLLIILPTRELAVQVDHVIKDFASVVNLRSVPIFGGAPFFKQVQSLRKGADIIVATPGRLEDHVSQKTIDLSRVSHLVLDEADQMLDIGFLPAIKRIIGLLPKNKQTLLFSATMPKAIKELARDYLQRSQEVKIASAIVPVGKINQQVLFLLEVEKLSALRRLIQERPKERILVFFRTKHGVDKVVKTLSKAGLNLDAIHGNKSQNQRQRALENFRKGKCLVLIATDIAARGIDVRDVELVINFDLPDVPEIYVHRIGRTARAGATGQAISFCSNKDEKNLKSIEQLINLRIQNISLDWKKIGRPHLKSNNSFDQSHRKHRGLIGVRKSKGARRSVNHKRVR
tara:strand:+ start:578 stop:1831 length:1254 start_codon:yes stop_codon:yes gene_type:complete